MAEKFISYTKHGVVETSSLCATHGGAHIYNVIDTVNDIDNGSVIKLGDYVEFDYFNAAVPAVTDAILLVATEPKIYSEFTKKMQEESNFYNGKGERFQADDIVRYDRFALSAECFDDGDDYEEPAVGQYVGVTGTGYNLAALGTSVPSGRGFVGYIYEKANNGNFRIIVLRNQNVETSDAYTLPTASASTLGGIKVGTGLTIEDGVLSVTATE